MDDLFPQSAQVPEEALARPPKRTLGSPAAAARRSTAESGLREADLPVWRREAMTPSGESTSFSSSFQGKELFGATDNFLSRAQPRLSFGTPSDAGPAARADPLQ